MTPLPLAPAEQAPLLAPSSPSHTRSTTMPLFKIAATMLSFAVVGLFTSSLGVLIPHIETHYRLSDTRVSFLFIAATTAYILAAQLNGWIHATYGRRGVAVIGPVCHLVSAGVAACQQPRQSRHHSNGFGVLLAAWAIGGFGTGVVDGSWCAWAAGMEERQRDGDGDEANETRIGSVNTISGMLHGSFSVGAALGPFVAGTMIDAGKREWYTWFYILFLASLLELIALSLAFSSDTANTYHASSKSSSPSTLQEQQQQPPSTLITLKRILSYPATHQCALYSLAYVGTESSISNWLVTFLTRADSSQTTQPATTTATTAPYIASLASSAFWVGMASGRFLLGPMTDKLGVRAATRIYLVAAISLQLIFITVTRSSVYAFSSSPSSSPSSSSSSSSSFSTSSSPFFAAAIIPAIMACLGFTCGPLFPSGMVVLMRSLPDMGLHIPAASFVASVGQVGGALLPFAIGALSSGSGEGGEGGDGIKKVFGWVVLLFLGVALGVWNVFAKGLGGEEEMDAMRRGRRRDVERLD